MKKLKTHLNFERSGREEVLSRFRILYIIEFLFPVSEHQAAPSASAGLRKRKARKGEGKNFYFESRAFSNT